MVLCWTVRIDPSVSELFALYSVHFEIKRQIWKCTVICILAVSATAVNSLTLTWRMSATPCLHIFSCWDRNNTRPSLLCPYLSPDFTADDSTGNIRQGANSQAFPQTALLAWLPSCHHHLVTSHTKTTCTEMSRTLNSSVVSLSEPSLQ